MTPGRERQAELRQRRLKQGVRQVTVWLDQASLDRLAAVRQPGERDSEVVRRALEVLEAQEVAGRPSVTSDPTPELAAVTSDNAPAFKRNVTSDVHAPAVPLTLVTSDVTSDRSPPAPPEATNGPPEIAPKDAPLVALLRQEPPLTYAAVAARLGISESQVKHKAAVWTKQGLLDPRPRGGPRPRGPNHAP